MGEGQHHINPYTRVAFNRQHMRLAEELQGSFGQDAEGAAKMLDQGRPGGFLDQDGRIDIKGRARLAPDEVCDAADEHVGDAVLLQGSSECPHRLFERVHSPKFFRRSWVLRTPLNRRRSSASVAGRGMACWRYTSASSPTRARLAEAPAAMGRSRWAMYSRSASRMSSLFVRSEERRVGKECRSRW